MLNITCPRCKDNDGLRLRENGTLFCSFCPGPSAQPSFAGKIQLIKKLREMSNQINFSIDPNTHTIKSNGVGLKDAKDFVEECMALGKQEYINGH